MSVEQAENIIKAFIYLLRESTRSSKIYIAEFMENSFKTELDEEPGYSKYNCKNKNTENSRSVHSSKHLAPTSAM